MASEQNLLELMIERAVNANDEVIDVLAVQMFCSIVRQKPSLIHKSTDLIVSKIKSTNIAESIRAVTFLEECMSKCGTEFQDEVAKFRFLNDLIRLVSKKYQGSETPPAVREKILDCLLLWTTEYPQKNKIRDAYDMLRKEGVEHNISNMGSNKQENIMGVDEQKLRKLIQSGDAENFKRANLLIQNRVSQVARRSEFLVRHKSELQEVRNTVGLLNQMLDTWIADESSGTAESKTLMGDLYISCKRYKPVLERLPELIENKDEDLTAETLETCDILQSVMERYKSTIVRSSNALNDLTTTNKVHKKKDERSNIDLLSGLMEPQTVALNIEKTNNKETIIAKCSQDDPMDELNVIFANAEIEQTPTSALPHISRNLFENLDLLTPTPAALISKLPNKESPNNENPKKQFRELKDIDKLSEELFKENLLSNGRIGTFKKDQEKITLNDLVKGKFSSSIPNVQTAPNPCDEDCVEKPLADADTIIDQAKIPILCAMPTNCVESPQMTPSQVNSSLDAPVIKHLSDIKIELDDVTPNSQEILLLDDDIKVTLNFTEDRPSLNVSVIVISVDNQSKLPVTDFHFEASVRKPSKVRLLPPTDNAMPGLKPFRPPTPINQVMLLLNPTSKAIDVTCIVGYKLGDDPDPVKESVVAKNIPYVE